MRYQVFARQYRPQTFEDIVGQDSVIQTLKNALHEERVGHAYLFTGPRGVGKTSIARILAKALNCIKGPTADPCLCCEPCQSIAAGQDIDVIEMDAASNRLVEDARLLRDSVPYAPLRSKFKIYILDEAHMLTRDAFNTLLKTLEEPPPHVKFFFATTEPQKVIETILSRCQRFDLKRITTANIVKRLQQICDKEKIQAELSVLNTLAQTAQGALRDAESLLDQLASYKEGKITLRDVELLLGWAPHEQLHIIVQHIQNSDAKLLLESIEHIVEQGIDFSALLEQLIHHIRQLLLVRMCGKDSKLLDVEPEQRERLAQEASTFSAEALLYFMQLLFEAKRRIREGANPRLVTELTLLKMSQLKNLVLVVDGLNAIKNLPKEALESLPSKAPTAISVSDSSPPISRPEPIPAEPSLKNVSSATDEKEDEADAIEGPLSLDHIKNRWAQVLEEVRQRKPTVAAYLREAVPHQFQGDDLTLQFPPQYSFHMRQLEHMANRAIVEAAIEKLCGKKLTLNCVMDARAGNLSPTPLEKESVQHDSVSKSTVPSDPLVKKILDMFEAKVVQVSQEHKK